MAPATTTSAQGGMFHTFQGVTPRKPASEQQQENPKSSSAAAAKRITTPHACAECKRRKIRCDGQQPCGQCLSSRAPKRCFYDKHRQRVIPSRKTLEALSQSLEECRSILNRLYPTHDVQSLLPLSRHELLDLLDRPFIDTSLHGLPSPPLTSPTLNGELDSPICSTSGESLSTLEQLPGRDTEWDEERRGREPIPVEADDVNALSLSVDRQTSYLGASSIKAALMVMLKVQPQLRNALAAPLNTSEIPHSFPAARTKSSTQKDPQRIPWSWKGQTLIDAYFKRIHVFIPMLDETSFRADYLEGQRFDVPWLALVNMVFAMGSIVAMKSDDYNHVNYYNRAMEFLPLDAFGSSHIETVQALALIGGYYLHYINRPNMANAVLGGTIRMASALGLHRESLAQSTSDVSAAETRRRTWWSLFCLDTWATTTMGRPSFGRWGSAINIRAPEFGINSSRDSSQHAGILPLIENIKFCKIATAIQDTLAVAPLVSTEDRHSLDGQLVNWYSSLPWLLRTTDPCAEPLYIARCIMKWRYQNLRMLLHRPVLLSLASANAQEATDLAKHTIDDIAREWTRNQMQGWNAAWFLYQAAMVPLVSVFWQWNSPRVPEWNKQIETVIELLDAMEDWSLAARRSREVVWRMYEASRTIAHTRSEAAAAAPLTPGSLHSLAISTDMSALLAGSPGSELHMSPIGLGPDGIPIMDMLDQHGLLMDHEGMYWGQADDMSLDQYSGVHDGGMGLGAPQQQQQPIDYSMLTGPGGHHHPGSLDGGYPFVH
ncbi:hypothetical protein INS49_000481 [Diaporthe citri]|uniref:uncharacterized protein n=1 Tax=Diaporthe citri TaxID=83186 RepID=UPI001C8034CE|nr:uncharacterized protein INS49_000481 [Diaporthe citri]KAG6366304.1 hypothetical protein INS49_000481 [Diaporthe citri]